MEPVPQSDFLDVANPICRPLGEKLLTIRTSSDLGSADLTPSISFLTTQQPTKSFLPCSSQTSQRCRYDRLKGHHFSKE
jgi:hypothetical protein